MLLDGNVDSMSTAGPHATARTRVTGDQIVATHDLLAGALACAPPDGERAVSVWNSAGAFDDRQAPELATS
jgi:hypothetical protein